MSRKDYRVIAAVLHETRPANKSDLRIWDNMVSRIADVLQQDNPRFNRSKFVDAAEWGL